MRNIPSLLAFCPVFLGLLASSVGAQTVDSVAPTDQREGAKPPISITTTNTPSGAGTVVGGGSKTAGSAFTLTAAANATVKAVFLDWTVNGVVVSSKTPYTFTPTANETVVANFGYAVTTSSEPAAGGTTGGAGAYSNSQSVTVTATPGACYDFTGWTLTGQKAVLSTDASYNFTLETGESLVANFQLKEDVITTASYPLGAGTTTGGGNKNCGATVTLTAKPGTGYKFNGWTLFSSPVSMANPYSFEAEGTETLTANFADISVPTVTFTSPKASESVASSVLTVSGTANNALGVSSVVLTVGGVPFTVSSDNNWSNWTANVILKPGANVIDVYAVSEADHDSKTATITVTDTSTGNAPISLAGLIAEVVQGANSPFQACFGAATYEQFSTDTNQGSAVGNYTYTQTGANTATLLLVQFAPPNQGGQGNTTVNLTFTSPTAATFVDGNGHTGTLTLSSGATTDFSSLSGWTIVESPGTPVTGTLQFAGGGQNAFDPANNGVPSGYANSSSPTVTLVSGDNIFDYGKTGSYNYDSADFNGGTLTVRDIMNGSGADPWVMTFTDPAFTGISKVSDNYINGGITPSIIGDEITLTWAGSYSPTDVLSGTYTAVFNVTGIPSVPYSTYYFGDEVFTNTDSNGTNTYGIYTSAEYGPMATMVVETNGDPYVGGWETNYTMYFFTSAAAGNFFVTHFDGLGDPPTYFAGTFTGTYHPIELKYVAPESLNGISALVTQTMPTAGTPFTTTFGQTTSAQTSSSTSVGSSVANYTYIRSGPNTALLTINNYLPSSSGSGAYGLFFESSTSVVYSGLNGSGNVSAGKVTLTTIPETGYFAPASLSQASITADFGAGNSGTATFKDGNFSIAAASKYGTYTYAPFSPTVGMVTFNLTDPAHAGEVEYVQLTFKSSASGVIYDTKSDGTAQAGTFTMTK